MEEPIGRGTEAKITDEMVQELLTEKGKEHPARHQWNSEGTRDTFRHWADGIGDPNPFWRDEEYAKKTRWKGLIAQPLWLMSCGYHASRFGMPGVHALHAGMRWVFHKPVHVYDRVFITGGLHDVVERPTQFGGRTFFQTQFANYRNQDKEIIATAYSHVFRYERETSQDRSYYSRKPHVHTEEELQRIGKGIEEEEIRGNKPRYWEDVKVGDVMQPVVKGPYTMSDAVCFKMAWGSHAPYHMWANEVRYWVIKRRPKVAMRNELNVPDCPERVHMDKDAARDAGLPSFFDYGPQRIAWASHLCTNWMGDDGWLRELEVQVRRPGLEGDTQWYSGRVTAKSDKGGEHIADCEFWAENQYAEKTVIGRAKIVLPTRS